MDRSHGEAAMAISGEEAYLLSVMHSLWKHRCISVLLGLKIPELLCNCEKPSMNIEELAVKAGCKSSDQLYTIMRLMSQWGIGKELENKKFCKNKALELLRRDSGPSLGHVFEYHGSEEHYSALTSLGECVKQGTPAFVLQHGMDHFQYLYDMEKRYDPSKMFCGSSEYKIGSDERRKEFAENYSSAMSYYTKLAGLSNHEATTDTVYNVFPWSTCKKIVDIGGSSGFFLASILKLPDCDHIQGYVMELPEMVEEAESKVHDLGIPKDKLKFIKQDFTQTFSQELYHLEADTVMFKNIINTIIHDREMMEKVLSNCRSLFSVKGGRLLIIDYFAPDIGEENVGRNGLEMGTQSVHWLSITGTRVYTKKEWSEYLNATGNKLGYQLEKIHHTFNGGMMLAELSFAPN